MVLFDLLTRHRYVRWASLPLRVIVAFRFVEHGFAKLSKGPDAFAAILHAMYVPAPHIMAWLTILTEIGGGLAVILGGLVAIVALRWPQSSGCGFLRCTHPTDQRSD
jgi:putative oxidoreductase